MLTLRALCSLHLGRCVSGAAAEYATGTQLQMVVGLGNYGMGGTRHNVGMDAVNLLACRLSISDQWKKDKQSGADIIQTHVNGRPVILLKPRQFMNINGKSVASAAGKFRLAPENIYLLHDELDKPLGKVSLKLGGSARGHQGVRSCIECLQTDCMVRLRIGIGRPTGSASVERHVLGRFTRAEQDLLPEALDRGVDLVLDHIERKSRTVPSGSSGLTDNGVD
ncbi:peptidyl-tRNA hydrolase [Discoglossus pictus]